MINKTYQTCEDCRNSVICKYYTQGLEEIKETIDKGSLNTFSDIFEITVKCSNFVQKGDMKIKCQR